MRKNEYIKQNTVAEQAGLYLTWSLIPEDMFQCDVDQIFLWHFR